MEKRVGKILAELGFVVFFLSADIGITVERVLSTRGWIVFRCCHYNDLTSGDIKTVELMENRWDDPSKGKITNPELHHFPYFFFVKYTI